MNLFHIEKIRCPKCSSVRVQQKFFLGMSRLPWTCYSCQQCKRSFRQYLLFFFLSIVVAVCCLISYEESYGYSFLENHILLLSFTTAMLIHLLWICPRYEDIKKHLLSGLGKQRVTYASAFYMFLITFSPYLLLHGLNTRLDTSERMVLYGDFQRITLEARRRGGSYRRAHFYVHHNGRSGEASRSISDHLRRRVEAGQKVQLMLVVRQGFLGWQWIEEIQIIPE